MEGLKKVLDGKLKEEGKKKVKIKLIKTKDLRLMKIKDDDKMEWAMS